MGGLLIAGLALSASLIIAPLGAYAADVPTPELKDTYVLDDSFYVGHSPSGRYVLYVDESTEKTCLLDAKDGSHAEVANVKVDVNSNYYDVAFCFSVKEDFLYCLDNTNYSVAVFDISKGKSEEYPLGSYFPSAALEDDSNYGGVKFQLSKDNKSLCITSFIRSWDWGMSNSDGESASIVFSDGASASIVFSVVDLKNGNTTSKCEYPLSDDRPLGNVCFVDNAWISNDGKYGYVVRGNGDPYDYSYDFDVATIDLKSQQTINTSKIEDFDKSGSFGIFVCDDGAYGEGTFVSKTGEVTFADSSSLDYLSHNQDASLTLGLSKEEAGDYRGSGSSDLGDREMAVIDNKTGKTKWKTNIPADYAQYDSEYAHGHGGYGGMSSDGAYVLSFFWDDDFNCSLFLLDTKTGEYSQVQLKDLLEYDYASYTDFSTWFSKDDSLIYAVQRVDVSPQRGIRVDVYKSGITRDSLLSIAQDEDGTLALNPVAIILFAAFVVVCGVVSLFILSVRKTSRRSVAPAATVDYAAFRSAASQGDSSACAQVHPRQTSVPIDCPRFCGSCGGPLVPGTRFCPHCGAPVKH